MEIVVGRFDGAPIDELAKLDQIADETDTTIQAFDARYIASERHLQRAVELADRAIARDDTIADDRGVEIMLYAAGRRQIDRAFEIGLKSDPHPVAIVIDGENEERATSAVISHLQEELAPEDVFCDRAMIQTFFEISDAEVSTGFAIEDLVLERVALLAIDK